MSEWENSVGGLETENEMDEGDYLVKTNIVLYHANGKDPLLEHVEDVLETLREVKYTVEIIWTQYWVGLLQK